MLDNNNQRSLCGLFLCPKGGGSLNAFILDGTINSRTDLGLRITQVPVIPTSERVIESIEVDGREGDLTLLKGWNDMTGSVAKF